MKLQKGVLYFRFCFVLVGRLIAIANHLREKGGAGTYHGVSLREVTFDRPVCSVLKESKWCQTISPEI